MRQRDLINIANRHYPDGMVAGAYKYGKKFLTDGLAKFIVSDLDLLCRSYPTDDEQLEEAERRMQTAVKELLDVANGFADARRKLAQKTGKPTARPRGRGRRVNFKKPRSKLVT